MLYRHLDDAILGSFNSLHFYNNVHIIESLTGDKDFIPAFIGALKPLAVEPTLPAKNGDNTRFKLRKELFMFLQEIFNVTKPLQNPNPVKTKFFAAMSENGLLAIIEGRWR